MQTQGLLVSDIAIFVLKRDAKLQLTNPRSTLAGQISSECVHCVGFRWPKKTDLWANFDILGAPVPTIFHQSGPCQISSRPLLAKNPIFAVFLDFMNNARIVVADKTLKMLKVSSIKFQ